MQTPLEPIRHGGEVDAANPSVAHSPGREHNPWPPERIHISRGRQTRNLTNE